MARTSIDSDLKKNIASLRIGLFTDTYAPQVNGVSISLQLVSEGLQRRGHQVTIFAPRIPGYTDEKPGVVRLPSLKYLNDARSIRFLPIPEFDMPFDRLADIALDLAETLPHLTARAIRGALVLEIPVVDCMAHLLF